MINHNEWMVVGLITSPHGIKGNVKVKSLSDFEERFIKPGTRWIQRGNEHPSELELVSGFRQPGKDSFVVSFKEIINRDQAEKLKQFKILVRIHDIPKLQKGEFHISELINLKVKILDNEELKIIGEVINLDTEKNHLLVIRLFENNKHVLVPFVKEIIPKIIIEENFLIINPPKGLFDI